jgi:hypothetical protein
MALWTMQTASLPRAPSSSSRRRRARSCGGRDNPRVLLSARSFVLALLVALVGVSASCSDGDAPLSGGQPVPPTEVPAACAADSEQRFQDLQTGVLFDVYCPGSLPQGMELVSAATHDPTGQPADRIVELQFADSAGLQLTLRQGALPASSLVVLTPDAGETLRAPARYGPYDAVLTTGRLVAAALDGSYHEIVADALPLEVLRRIGLDMRPLPPPGEGEG